MDWPTIETAPKDGTSILGWNGDEFCICRWYRQSFHKHPKPYWDLGNGYSEKYARANQPTHWMPLPPPPTVTQSLTVPPVVKESLTPALPTDDDLDEPLGPAPTHWMPLPPPSANETE